MAHPRGEESANAGENAGSGSRIEVASLSAWTASMRLDGLRTTRRTRFDSKAAADGLTGMKRRSHDLKKR
jgi:hypothetical protein